MALTVSEAQAVNDVLGWFLNSGWMSGRPVPSEKRAMVAAEMLAEHADRTLMAGVTPDLLMQAWGRYRQYEEERSG